LQDLLFEGYIQASHVSLLLCYWCWICKLCSMFTMHALKILQFPVNLSKLQSASSTNHIGGIPRRCSEVQISKWI
jgi:hypothetical protein